MLQRENHSITFALSLSKHERSPFDRLRANGCRFVVCLQ